MKTLKAFKFAVFLFLAFSSGQGAYAEDPRAVEILADIPVQHNGRVKPFESFAKEAVMTVTGKTQFQGLQPRELAWRWIVEPEKWNEVPMIGASYPSLRDLFVPTMLIKNRITPELLLNYEPFLQRVQEVMAKQDQKEKLLLGEKKIAEAYHKAVLFRTIGRGEIPGWVAHPQNPLVGWLSLQAILSPEGGQILTGFFPEENVVRLGLAVQNLFTELRHGFDSDAAALAASEFSEALNALFEAGGIVLNERILNMERTYNHLRPFHWAWMIYLAAAIFWILTALFSRQKAITLMFTVIAWLAFVAGFVLHSYGFYLRCMIAGRPPVSNMYESIVWVSWGVVFFSVILSFFYRTPVIRIFAATVAALALLIAQSFPALLDPFVSPLVPVLRSNLWLTVHVLTITLSYAAFALAWGLGHGVLFRFALWPEQGRDNQTMTLYLYRAVQIGVVLLAAGTVLGGVWANYSWGRFWGWDPKETWALIALLGYIAVLHGRFSGWMGPFGFAAGCVVAFLGILMAWYGVNYVLAAGLHSYGFGGGGLPYVSAVVGLDLLFVLSMSFLYRRKCRKMRGEA